MLCCGRHFDCFFFNLIHLFKHLSLKCKKVVLEYKYKELHLNHTLVKVYITLH